MNKYNEVEIQTAKNLLKQGYKWLARTFQGSVGAFSCKPCKKGGCWFYPSNLACTTGKTVTVSGKFTPLFQSIKWEDNEPTYIEDIINPQIVRCKDCKHNPKLEWFGCPMSHLNEKQRPETAWCWKGERKDDE